MRWSLHGKYCVVLQFSFAIILIICTIIVQQQINHAKDRESGYDKNNLIYHFLTGDISKNYALIKKRFDFFGCREFRYQNERTPYTGLERDSWGFIWDGKDPNDKTDFDRYSADEDFLKTTGLQLVKGRDLDLRKYNTDSSAMILNESALKIMKFKEPIGQLIKDGGCAVPCDRNCQRLYTAVTFRTHPSDDYRRRKRLVSNHAYKN